MFIDREEHLRQLEQLYKEPGFYSVSLYADRGMGKTAFLRELTRQKKTLFFRALNTTEEENFLALKTEIERVLGPSDKLTRASRFAELLRLVGRAAKEERLLFIIDNFPFLVQKNRRLSTLFHSYVEKEWAKSQLFLILCKHERKYQKEKGQAHRAVLLRPFTFFEMRRLFPDLTPAEQVSLYGITGGVPGYLKYFLQDSTPFTETLFQLFFTDTGSFWRLPSAILQSSTPEPQLAHSALLCLGAERRKLHEICDRTKLTPSAAGSLMTYLGTARIAEKIIPVTEDEGSRRTLYRICDSVFRFWYTFAAPHVSAVELGQGREIFDKRVLPVLDSYFKDTFEDICRQFLDLQQQMGHAPFPYSHAGSWWGQHPTRKRTEFVPIAAIDENNILLGNCFWTDEWIDLDGLQDLQRHAGLFPHNTKWYTLFSRSDFVSGMETIYGDTVKVFTLEQMCRLSDTYHLQSL